MLVRLVWLVLTFTLVTGIIRAQDYRPKAKNLGWGPDANGLRMATWTNPGTAKVFAVIRNFSSQKICYCDYVLGHFIKVYTRQNPLSEWLEIKLKPPTPEEIKNQIHIGFLPCSKNKFVQPGQEMPSYPYWIQSNIKPPKNERNKNYSFSLDLSEYVFPSDMSGEVEVKIVQHIFNGRCDEAYDGQVESPGLKVKLPINKVET